MRAALKQEAHPKVFVHCQAGASRSAAVALAYLMAEEGLKLSKAVELMRAKREICPNDGFIQQLIDFEVKLLATKTEKQ